MPIQTGKSENISENVKITHKSENISENASTYSLFYLFIVSYFITMYKDLEYTFKYMQRMLSKFFFFFWCHVLFHIHLEK